MLIVHQTFPLRVWSTSNSSHTWRRRRRRRYYYIC